MAADDKKKKEVNPEADAKNWEDRLRTEQEAPHRWAEAWGECFDSGVPHEYSQRLAYLESKVKSLPPVKPLPKYGVGSPFKDVLLQDYRLKGLKDQGKYED